METETRTEPDRCLFDREAFKFHFGNGTHLHYGRLIRENNLWEAALGRAFDPDRQVGFRAAWALEKAYFEEPEAFRPYLPRFLNDFLRTENRSVQRSYGKMLAHILKEGLLSPTPPEKEAIVAVCFDRLIDPGTPIAVQIWCMTILEYLSPLEAWADEALRDILRERSTSDSPGLRNRSGKFLRKIGRKRLPTNL